MDDTLHTGHDRVAALEAALRRSEARLAETQRIARVGSWELDPVAGTFSGSAEAFRLLGLGATEGACPLAKLRDVIASHERAILDRILRRASAFRPARFTREFRLAGHPPRTVVFTGELARGQEGRRAVWTGTVQDVTEAVASREQIRTLAYFDPLTGLPNRLQFVEQVRGALGTARRHDRHVALMMVDLDHFKRINDTLGHGAGDEVLRVVGNRLQLAVRDHDLVLRDRASSGTESTVARMGGDEFLLAIGDLERGEHAATVAHRLLEALAAPIPLSDGPHEVSASVGISVFPEDGETFEVLLKHADVALYQAKDTGRNAYAFYDRRMSEAALQRLALESSLRQAVANRRLNVVLQPKVDGTSGALLGSEALLRWHDPIMGNVPPSVFIALAERIGLATELARFGFDVVTTLLADWQARGLPVLPIAINVSPQVFRDPAAADLFAQIMDEAGVDPRLVELEITETALIDDPERAELVFERLRALGFRIALDDFGTGFSSLSHLRRFRLDALKIDRAFVRELQGSPRDASIVRAIVQLAESLGLVAIAEGVEHDAQRRLLLSLGCTVMQGYLFGKPMPTEEFTARLAQRGAESTESRGDSAAA
ncbi:MAG TPA: EAL domain-containing protein [Gemmatimonadaceae bacterium]|nr:EAL domain-containing protein [Gemmatimonadaceae bacterium]